MATSSSPASKQILRIGIETEFYLRRNRPSKVDRDLKTVASAIVASHNEEVSSGPRMMENLDKIRCEDQDAYHKQWRLVGEPDLKTKETVKPPWGLEMVSPIFDHKPDSNWRKIVSQTWSTLRKEFVVLTDDHCSTQVHISLPQEEGKCPLDKLVLIGQAIIHFEPAVEAILPECRRGNGNIKSGFLQYIELLRVPGQEDLTRNDVIDCLGEQNDIWVMSKVMNPHNRLCSWDFYRSLKTYSTIEFRLGAGSTSADDVFMWVEFATKFVRAALAADSGEAFTKFQQNVGGLREFLSRGRMEGEGPGCLEGTLFRGKRDHERLEPQKVTTKPLGEPGAKAHDGNGIPFSQ